MIPLLIVLLILAILFEVYKSDFERWVTPLTDWLDDREAWSWVIPVVILVVLSFPPLFGHEIVLLVVGVSTTYLLSSTHDSHASVLSRSQKGRGIRHGPPQNTTVVHECQYVLTKFHTVGIPHRHRYWNRLRRCHYRRSSLFVSWGNSPPTHSTSCVFRRAPPLGR